MCSYCRFSDEGINHLFLQCSFAKALWSWLQDMIQIAINLLFTILIFNFLKRSWSSQGMDVLASMVVHAI
uniref:Reverse transcriptase zinc-binding domain-containing protein n=1 Tax=Cajanus cajan TaxID=3821 RepID=A0A151U6H7_CAJCA|nr:hypothetical protein KK1_007618 [Cajanus cajan]